MRTRTLVAGLGVATAATLAGLMPRPAGASPGVELHVRIGASSLEASDSADPVVLDPKHSSVVHVEVNNDTNVPTSVHTLRLNGTVAGLDFFAFETTLPIDVAPHADEVRDIPLDLAALDGQAVGLLPATFQVLDANRHVIASDDGVVDVRGSIASVYGVWGIVAAILTAIQLAQLSVALANHRLPRNRWRRALRFAALGASFGTLIVFALSAARVMAPYATVWAPVVGGTALVLFTIGWFSPAGYDDEDEDDEERENVAPVDDFVPPADDELAVTGAVTSGHTTRRVDIDLSSPGHPWTAPTTPDHL
jgi:hypothetical protein